MNLLTHYQTNIFSYWVGIKYLDNVKLVESLAVKEETVPSIGQEMLPSSERVQKPDLDHCFRTAENVPLLKSEPEPSEIPR